MNSFSSKYVPWAIILGKDQSFINVTMVVWPMKFWD